MTIAIYPATFDPITYGHVDIATRGASIFEKLIVGVYDRPLKNVLFSPEERWDMVSKAMQHLPNVQVKQYHSLTYEFARQWGARVIVRGLRVLSDFEWEFQLALTNRQVAPDIDTICLMASQEYSFLSSSIVKDIALHGGRVDEMAPPHVVAALAQRFKTLGKDGGGKVSLVSLRD
jgi:pantetheine-phosphate adenylyltransferase